MGKEKSKLDSLMGDLNKKYKNVVIKKLGDTKSEVIEWWDLSSLRLTDVLGKGLPKGRIGLVKGGESTAKTTLCMYLASEVQCQGGKVAFIDIEKSFDEDHARNVGLDISNLFYVDPENAEQGMDIMIQLIETGEIDLIIVDSVAAMVPEAELDSDTGKDFMGLQARLLGKVCRKITPKVKKNKTTVLFVNQIRSKIGVMFGSNEAMPGGKALPFYASFILDTKRIEYLQENQDTPPYGAKFKVRAIKNKVAPPFKVCEMTLDFQKGYDFNEEIVEYAVSFDIISKGGAWYGYKGSKFQGSAKVVEYLLSNPDELLDVQKRIKDFILHKNNKTVQDDTGEIGFEDSIELSNNIDIEIEED